MERRSRFIGHAAPVKTEEEAVAFINEMKAKYWDATHNVYAYCLRDGQIKRYSDDSEPQGTAGIPTLDVLQKSGVTDTVVVVTRYFGGVLLGAGGLVRAYSHGASIALEAAGIVTMRECVMASLSCDYNQYGRLQALIPECGGTVDDTVFGERVTMYFHLTTSIWGVCGQSWRTRPAAPLRWQEEGTKFFRFYKNYAGNLPFAAYKINSDRFFGEICPLMEKGIEFCGGHFPRTGPIFVRKKVRRI